MTLQVIFNNYVIYVSSVPLDVLRDNYSLFDAIYQAKVANVGHINNLMHSFPTLAENVVNNMVPGPEDLNRALSKVYESEEQIKSVYRSIKNAPEFSTVKNALVEQLQNKVSTHVSRLENLNQTSSNIIQTINQLNR